MSKIITTKIVLRNDTTENWQAIANELILLQGEIGIEYASTGTKMKIGNGTSTWAELPYFITEGAGEKVELPESYTWEDLFGAVETQNETSSTEHVGLVKPSYADVVDVTVLNANSDLIDAKIFDLQESIAQINTTISSHEERIAALENNVGGETISPELEGKVTENTNRIVALEETVGGYDERIIAAEEAVAGYDEKIEAAVAATEKVETLSERVAAAEASAIESKTKIDLIEPKVEEAVVTVTSMKETVDTVSAEMESTNARLETLIAGSTDDGNLELVDIRTAADGTVYDTAGAHVRALDEEVDYIKKNTADLIGGSLVDGLSYEGYMLQLTANGKPIGEAVEIKGGSGGGTGSGSYGTSLVNLLDSRIIAVPKGESVVLKFRYTSKDGEGFDDGPGIGTIHVDNVRKATFSVPQGENEYEVTNYLGNGTNTVKLTVENSEGTQKVIIYTITVIALTVSTTASTMDLYTGNVSFPYNLTGNGAKTVHFIMDEYEMGTEVITATESSRVYNIPVQQDGAHILTIYAEVENEGQIITSNKLRIGMMWYSSTMTTQAVLINYDGETITQGETLTIPYMCYDPFTQNMEVTLNIYNERGVVYNTKSITIDQTPKTWVTQDYPIGATKFEIVCGEAKNSITLNVNESTFDREILTDSMVLEFSAAGRSNDEPNPEQWSYGDYEATFNGFGWAGADGWVEDNDGQTVLRFLPGNEMQIPYMPFAADFRNSGYTIEAEFASHNVRDYETVIAASYSGDRGFQIRSQMAELSSEQSYVSTQFQEDTKVRVTFVVEQKNLTRFIYTYINGVMCDVVQYPESDNFGQTRPVGITIGADSCGLDLYTLRFYSKGLTRQEQLNNFICDRPNLAERQEAAERNDILDENGNLTIASLPMHIPYMILECEELPQYKGDKKKNKSVTYVDRLHPEFSFTAAGVQLDVQGTSSAGYPVKNYKVALKSGLTFTNSGEYSDGFPFAAGGLLGETFCLKADFASSENANNVMLVDYYEGLVPYKTPPQELDDRVRTGIRGFAGVVFWQNTETGEVTFLGKYNINDDKSNENVFGFDSDVYPACECWEFCNNTSNRVIFKESDYEKTITVTNSDGSTETYPAWYDDFEARFPDLDDPYRDYTRLKRVTDWIVSTDRDAVVSQTEKDARLKKFKDEFEDYFIKDASIFYYLFTECFLMVDSRAKNMFLTTFDGEHWLPIPYDFDTALGM